MTEKQLDPAVQAEPELRAQLARRLAVAGTLVAVLLGVLALFDRFTQPAEEEEVAVYTRPVPVAPPKILTQPVTPVEPEAAPVEADAEPAAPDAVAEPTGDTPPPPEVAADPVRQAAVSAPAGRRAAPAKEPEVVPEMTAPTPLLPRTPAVQANPEAAPVAPEAPAAPVAKVLKTTPAASRPPAGEAPSAPRLFSGFVLQAGVFASVQRAEELHARLTLSGVPSQIETRVQVGPFRTRREAAEAQAKLRELGIDSILVEPKGKR